jgi:hypothetical protein
MSFFFFLSAEIRVDAWKLCQIFRRPEPRSQESIGNWYMVLSIIANFAVPVNAGIIAYTGQFAQNYTWLERVWLFVIITLAIFGYDLQMKLYSRVNHYFSG